MPRARREEFGIGAQSMPFQTDSSTNRWPAAAAATTANPEKDMKFNSINKMTLVMALALFPSLYSIAKNDLSADDIMLKVDHAARKSFSTQLSSTKITTCKYKMVGGKVSCSEKPRMVFTENVKKVDIVNGVYSAKVLSIVREPASDKGSSLLVYEYGEKGRENDNWVYLPALAKVNRIIVNEDEGGSVFGSEFSVETTQNPDSRKVYEYSYKLVEETTYQDRPVWVIEITPKPERARKTRYQKVVAWIDKQSFLTVKEDMYLNGKVHKQRIQSGINKIDDVYVVTKVVINNLGTSRISQMDKTAMRHNVKVDSEFLSQRALTDFAFRERNLGKFRNDIQR
jgi:Outer membrane lipoprotein-sorting protein